MKILKLIVFPLFLVYNCLFAATMGVYVLGVLTLCLWIYLLLKSVDIEPSNAERRTAFKSDLIGKEINYKSNHCEYCLLLLLTVLTGLLSLLLCHIDSYLLALLFWVDLVVTLTWMVNLSHIVYGVVHNLTHEEMFQPELHPELWSKINYIIQRNILSRTYGNKRDKSLKENLRDYWNQRRGVLQSDE